MKNPDKWQPTKFVRGKDGLRSSRNQAHVGVASRFIADILAPCYERAIATHAKGRLLDLGCGHVPLYETYRDLVDENVCVDWGNTLHPNAHLDMTADLREQLPFEDQSFDTILLTDVLEHIPEPMHLMDEIARLLRIDGTLILGVPFFYWLHEEPHDYYRYTENALRRFCTLSGLTVVELNPYGGFPEVLIDLTSKGIGFLPQFVSKFLRPIHTAAAWLAGTKASQKLSKRTQSKLPLGYVLIAQRRQPEAVGRSDWRAERSSP